MKEYKYLYQAMLSEETIRKAYKNLRKGKTRRAEVKYIDAHLDDEVQKIPLYKILKVIGANRHPI